jgi:hypothetical protein
MRTTSNRGGYFALVAAPTKEFVLRLTYLGYTPKELTVGTDWGAERLAIEMVRTPLRLEAVSVIAEQSQVMKAEERVSTVKISTTEIAALPSIGEVDIAGGLGIFSAFASDSVFFEVVREQG